MMLSSFSWPSSLLSFAFIVFLAFVAFLAFTIKAFTSFDLTMVYYGEV